MKRGLAIIIPIFCLGLLLAASAHRGLWSDETLGIRILLEKSYSEMLLHGVLHQCSPAPFFYFLHKAWFGLIGSDGSGLVAARVLAAGSASLVMFLVFMEWRELPLAALLCCASLLNDDFFLSHATEARPYSLWLLLTFAMTIVFTRWIEVGEKRFDSIQLSILGLCLGMTSAGALFFFSGIFTYLFLYRRKNLPKFLLLTLPGLTLALYYALLSTCNNYAVGAESQYNFYTMLATRDFTLPKQICKMLFSPKSVVDLPINLLLFLALGIMIKKPQEFAAERRLLGALALVFTVEMLLTAAAITLKNYYFIPRMFIFLLVPRIFWIMCSALVVSRVKGFAIDSVWVKGALALYCVGLIVSAFHHHPLTLLLAN